MKFRITLFLLSAAVLIAAAFKPKSETPNLNTSSAITVEGDVSGFDCAVVGVLCPTTHRGADYTTGVFTGEKDFYFIVNIPQSFLQQYFRQKVEIEGTVYDPYGHAVEPEIIHLIEDGKRRMVYESGYFIDKNNNRATFQDGVFRNGRWHVQ